MALRIRARRLELGLSVTAAAKAAGVVRETWSNWESDIYSMTAERLPEVATVLRTTVSEIVGAP